MKNDIENLQILRDLKIPDFRLKQLNDSVYGQFNFDLEKVAGFPKNIIEALRGKMTLMSFQLVTKSESSNGDTCKFLLENAEGDRIETVLMKFRDGRNSVCVSTQCGCQMGCTFCATGMLGFKKNLNCEEIFDQVLFVCAQLHQSNEELSNVVIMGMGEPFMNYDNTLRALRMMNDATKLNIGARKITVSTSGIVPGIERFTNEPEQFNLAISLHAPDQKIREGIMPVAKLYKLETLIDVVDAYTEKTHRRVSFEYILLKGVNDQIEHANKLAKLLRHKLCHVNLIPFNSIGKKEMLAPARETVINFQKRLHKLGINATIRVAMGDEIAAACGQLANKTIQHERSQTKQSRTTGKSRRTPEN